MRLGKFIAAFVVAVYVIGCVHLSDEVRNSCVHGNCKHGRYSKFNGFEKIVHFLWMFGFPFGVYLVRRHLVQKSQKNSPQIPLILPTPQKSGVVQERSESKIDERLNVESVITNNSRRDVEIKCPVCGSGMVLRTAKRGRRRGSMFYGCQSFPLCRGLIGIDGNG